MKAGIDYIGIYVVAICHDGKDNVLYMHRSEKARDEKNKWNIGAGGTLEMGETLVQCLHRELEEETGMKAGNMQHLGRIEMGKGSTSQRCSIFLAQELTPGKRKLDKTEQDLIVKEILKSEMKSHIYNGTISDSATLESPVPPSCPLPADFAARRGETPVSACPATPFAARRQSE